MLQRFERFTVPEWLTGVGAGLAVLAALAALVLPSGGTNRVAGAAVPFAIAAVALAGNGYVWRRTLWGGVALFAVASLALIYGVILTLSVPLRLLIEGTCPIQVRTCPLGFEHPPTSGENVAFYVCTILAALSLMLVFTAAELRHMRQARPPGDR